MEGDVPGREDEVHVVSGCSSGISVQHPGSCAENQAAEMRVVVRLQQLNWTGLRGRLSFLTLREFISDSAGPRAQNDTEEKHDSKTKCRLEKRA